MATRQKAAEAEVEIEDVDPDPVETPQPVHPGQPQVADERGPDEVTGPSHLGFTQRNVIQEIEAEPVPKQRIQVDKNGLVEIRMARTIEEFTYGNPHRAYSLVEGRRYRLPLHVAQYLDSLGAIHHRI